MTNVLYWNLFVRRDRKVQLITSPVRESQELESQEGDKNSSTIREQGEQTTMNGSTESDGPRNGTEIQIIPQIEHTEHTICVVSSIKVDVETSRQAAVANTNPHKLNNVR